MIQSSDFKGYLKENEEFIKMLHAHDSILIHRLQDVLKVLYYICLAEEDNKLITEDEEIFFETGFSYFHEQLEMIKIYYSNYFDKDFHHMLKYERGINYLLYLDDLSEALAEKGYLDKERKNKLKDISTELEKIVKEKLELQSSLFEKYDLVLESLIPQNEDIHTTDYIFSLIIDEIE